jgi:hypothetical protein
MGEKEGCGLLLFCFKFSSGLFCEEMITGVVCFGSESLLVCIKRELQSSHGGSSLSVIPAFGRRRQGDLEFQASLSYKSSSRRAQQTKTKEK